GDELKAMANDSLVERWNGLMALRERVLAEIEPLRKDKRIGSSLQARVVLSGSDASLGRLKASEGDLPMLFIVSEVELRPEAGSADDQQDEPRVAIERAGGVKCERCWRYVASVSVDPAWAGLCGRCQDALAEPIHG
ncbi:MAG: zinc finger domain-containing protein, partial [Vicinamibacterales bacterium]